jgi:hypothetical protein
MSESVYLNKLLNTELFLASPIPLEITGSQGNYVATWIEGNVEGEGTTKDSAVEDCRQALIAAFKSLRSRVRKSEALPAEEDRKWVGLLHFIGENRAGRAYKPAPGEEYLVMGSGDDEYKGPIYG